MAQTFRVYLSTETGKELLYETPNKAAAAAEADRMNANLGARGIPGWVASAVWE